MDDLKQAYETLGLPENADPSEVDKRYEILLRQARARKRRGEDDPAGLEAITAAYRSIKDAENRRIEAELYEKRYGSNKKSAEVRGKLDHFFHYYKFHVLGAIALIILIVYGVNSYLDRQEEKRRLALLPPPAVTVSFFGEYYITDESREMDVVEQALLAQFPDWQRIVAKLTYVPTEMRSEQDMAYLQKSMIDLMTEKSDLYILDRANFDKLAAQGGLIPLDEEAAGRLQPLLPPGAALEATDRDTNETHVYGIDITASPLFQQLPLAGQEMIAGIRIDAQNRDNALLFIERYLQAANA